MLSFDRQMPSESSSKGHVCFGGSSYFLFNNLLQQDGTPEHSFSLIIKKEKVRISRCLLGPEDHYIDREIL